MVHRLLLAITAGFLFVGAAPAAEPLREVIDRHIAAAWKREKIAPPATATDAVFLRRVYLDLCGSIPTWQEAKAFLGDADPKKREKLIDRLLADPRYAQQQADKWDMVYFGRNPPGYKTNERGRFQAWLREQFAENTPYDEWARAILLAEGNSADDGPPMFLVQYKDKPEDATEAITQRFLGVQLQCARCHDHPFESWKQTDFFGMAAFLARLEVVTVGKKGQLNKFAIGEKNTGDIMFTGPATDQRPGKKGTPIKPKFLHGEQLKEPPLPKDVKDPRRFPANKMPPKPHFSRKEKLANWITDPGNPYFSRAVANRVWAQYMGRGLVHPVDNMSESNKPTHPELLDALAKALVERNFDLKWCIREIVSSRAYQAAAAGDVAEPQPRWYERAKVRPLSAEELAEAWRVATNYVAVDSKAAEKLKAARFYPFTSGYMLQFFGRPNDGTGVFQGGLHEHLYLNNGQVTSVISNREGGLLHAVAEGKESWPQRVERLFLATLSRRPSQAETEKFTAFLSAEEQPHDRVKEAIWALLTCSEFRFNH